MVQDQNTQNNVKEYLTKTRDMDRNFIHEISNEICPFCDKGKIVSGIYLQFNSFGYPCCNECYNKEGFNEWFAKCHVPFSRDEKQLDWFVDMFFRDYTPEEAMDDVSLVV
ncbi:MAG: hypothetical protein AAB657_01385 [Patescibacteria group bacterium]